MAIAEGMLAEFDQEMAGARKTLERIPEDKLDWRPHAKSMTLGRLAGHLAELPGWARATLGQDELDMRPPGQAPMEAYVAKSRSETLAFFDKSVAECRSLLAKASDQKMMSDWRLLSGGKELLRMPRVAVMRTFVLNHLVHHRAQLGVYLRLNDIPVPSIYGPSADEGAMPGS